MPDLNQGVVYGPVTPRMERAPRLIRGFDHEQVFAPHCTASAYRRRSDGHPLTVSGMGG